MDQGIRSLVSRYSVDETVTRLQALLEEKGVKLFCLVDHSGEALAAGFQMPPTKLLIFGNPKAGTPLMLAEPSVALDLPLRVLVSQAADGTTRLSWNDPAWMQQRHGFPKELTANIAAAAVLAEKVAE
ncbi:MAG: DUF302 domain-containing protein [Acidobacteriaceae bacterium]